MRSWLPLVLVSLFGVDVAEAHINITYPLPRYTYVNGDDPVQKIGPCGAEGLMGKASGVVTELGTGQEITVTWDETIDHPGHYRVALDLTGTDDFVDPVSPEDKEVIGNVVAYLDDAGGTSFSHTFTLPDTECDPCTLQVIQVMTDKLANGFGNDDIYYWCSDVTVKQGGGTSSSSATTTGGGGGATGSGATSGAGASNAVKGALENDEGCAMGGGAPSGWLLSLLVLAALRRRAAAAPSSQILRR